MASIDTNFKLGQLPKPRNSKTMIVETKLKISGSQKAKNKILEKLRIQQKKEKGQPPNRTDHPLQITKALGDYFNDLMEYHKYEYGNEPGQKNLDSMKSSNWSRGELIKRKRHFIKSNFNDYYKGETVLFDGNGLMLVYLIAHYEYCEQRYGGIVLGTDDRQKSKPNGIVLLKSYGKDVWTLPKSGRRLYRFKDNRDLYRTNTPLNKRLEPVDGGLEGDIQHALREVRERTGIQENVLKKHVHGYMTVDRYLHEMKLFVFIVPRATVKPGGWDTEKTAECEWIDWDFSQIDWERRRNNAVQLTPHQAARISSVPQRLTKESISDVLQRSFYFLKYIDQIDLTKAPRGETADLYSHFKENEPVERRMATERLPRANTVTSLHSIASATSVTSCGRPASNIPLQAKSSRSLYHITNYTGYNGEKRGARNDREAPASSSSMLRVCSQPSNKRIRCDTTPSLVPEVNKVRQQASDYYRPDLDLSVSSQLRFHDRPAHHNQPSWVQPEVLNEVDYELKVWLNPDLQPGNEQNEHPESDAHHYPETTLSEHDESTLQESEEVSHVEPTTDLQQSESNLSQTPAS